MKNLQQLFWDGISSFNPHSQNHYDVVIVIQLGRYLAEFRKNIP